MHRVVMQQMWLGFRMNSGWLSYLTRKPLWESEYRLRSRFQTNWWKHLGPFM
jgi:hypothetical protein